MNLARAAGRLDDAYIRELLAEVYVLQTVQGQTTDRIVAGIAAEAMPATSGAMLRLFTGLNGVRRSDIALEIASSDAVVWDARQSGGATGNSYIFRQAWCLGGGSTEMQRNIISERVLGMPREPAADRGISFKDVRRNAPGKGA